MQAKKFGLNQIRHWLSDGLILFKKHSTGFAIMALIYLATTFILDLVPFIGHLLVVLLTPVVIASTFLVCESLVAGETPDRYLNLRQIVPAAIHSAKQLALVYYDQEKMLAVMIISTLALGVVVIIEILALLLHVGGAALPAFASGSVGIDIWFPALLSLFIVWSLRIVLIWIVLYALYLVTLRHQPPLTAIENSLKAASVNASLLGVMSVIFLLPLIIATFLPFYVLLIVGVIMLPLLMSTVYGSGNSIFGK